MFTASKHRLALLLPCGLLLVLLVCVGCRGTGPAPFSEFEHENVLLTRLPEDEGEIKFLVLGDWGRRGQYFQRDVAAQMGRAADAVDADFVATTGDNFYVNGVGSVEDSHWEDSFEEVYTHLALHVPWYPTLGNHDYRGSVHAQIAYSEYSDRWTMPGRYHTFTRELSDTTHARFVFLDTPLLVPERVAVVPDQTVLTRRELAWIDSTLGATDARWKIAFGHHPLYSAGRHGNDERLIQQLRPLFRKHGVQFYLAGHDHNLQYLETEQMDQVVSGGGSRLRPVGDNPLAVFTSTRPGFALVAVAEEQVLVQLIDHRGNILYGEVIEHPMRLEQRPEPVGRDTEPVPR